MEPTINNIKQRDSQHMDKNIFLKLAYFNPNFSDKFGNQIIDYLVLDSLSSHGPLLSQSPSDVSDYIKKTFKLNFEEVEITAAARRLGKKGLIDFNEGVSTEEPPLLKILSKTEQKISSNIHRIRKLEEQVINDWKDELSNKYNNHPQIVNNLDKLVHHLQVVLSKLLYKHGIECVALLYPQDKNASNWVDTIEDNILDAIQENDEFITTILRIEIPSFLKKENTARKDYLTSLFNSSFFWHLIQVDDDFSRLLSKITSGQMLFLDANILSEIPHASLL